MWQPIEAFLRRLDRSRYRSNIHRALALQLRGEVRSDGLRLVRVRNRLEIRWRARSIHPWDHDELPERQAQLFEEQLTVDTEDAIIRIFEALPQIDRIELEVLEPSSDNLVLAGTVHRSALVQARRLLSVRMRLRQLGVTFFPIGSFR